MEAGDVLLLAHHDVEDHQGAGAPADRPFRAAWTGTSEWYERHDFGFLRKTAVLAFRVNIIRSELSWQQNVRQSMFYSLTSGTARNDFLRNREVL